MNQLSKMINPFYHNNYTKLAKVYKMKREKFSELIEPIRDEIKREDAFRNILTCKEIWKIVDYLGAPDPFEGIDPLYYNSITKLSDLYRVERPTFRRWLKPIKGNFNMENSKRYFYTPKEVRYIIDFIGIPVWSADTYHKFHKM